MINSKKLSLVDFKKYVFHVFCFKFVSVFLSNLLLNIMRATLNFAWEMTDRTEVTAHHKLSTITLSQNLKHVSKNSNFF